MVLFFSTCTGAGRECDMVDKKGDRVVSQHQRPVYCRFKHQSVTPTTSGNEEK